MGMRGALAVVHDTTVAKCRERGGGSRFAGARGHECYAFALACWSGEVLGRPFIAAAKCCSWNPRGLGQYAHPPQSTKC